jgi:DNA-binding transcriptional ArsR family regulator
VDEVFRALADPSLQRLLDRLYDRNGQTLRELCAGQGLSRQSVSKHLAILEAANLAAFRPGRFGTHERAFTPVAKLLEQGGD